MICQLTDPLFFGMQLVKEGLFLPQESTSSKSFLETLFLRSTNWYLYKNRLIP